MARLISDLEKKIRALSREQKRELLRGLIDELDTPSDPDVERKWLEAARRRYWELAESAVAAVPGEVVFERLRSRLAG